MPNLNHLKHLTLLTILVAAITIAITAGVVLAAETIKYTISLNVTDARYNITDKIVNVTEYEFFLNRTYAGYFLDGKKLILIVRNATDVCKTPKCEELAPEIVIRKETTIKGINATLEIEVERDKLSYYAMWHVVLLLEWKGKYWLVWNYTTVPATLASLLYNMSKLGKGERTLYVVNSKTYAEAFAKLPTQVDMAKIRAGLIKLKVVNITVNDKIVGDAERVLRLPYVQAFALMFLDIENKTLPKTVCSKLLVYVYAYKDDEVVYSYERLTYNKSWTDHFDNCTFGPIYYLTAYVKPGEEFEEKDDKLFVKVETVDEIRVVVKYLGIKGEELTIAVFRLYPAPLNESGALPLVTSETTVVPVYAALNTTRNVVKIDIAPRVSLPILTIELDLTQTGIKTLTGDKLPSIIASALTYMWGVEIEEKTIFFAYGKEATIVGNRTIAVNRTGLVAAECKKPELLGKYWLYITYSPSGRIGEAVAKVNITKVVKYAIEQNKSLTVKFKVLKVALLPVQIILKRYVPDGNASTAPAIDSRVADRLKVVIKRSIKTKPLATFEEYFETCVRWNGSKLVVVSQPYYYEGLTYRIPMVLLPARYPVELRAEEPTTSGEIEVVQVKPKITEALYYYLVEVYYDNVRVGIAEVAAGYRYTAAKGYEPVFDIIGGFEIVSDEDAAKKVSPFYWNSTDSSTTTTVTAFDKTLTGVRVLSIALTVLPVVVNFWTTYDKMLIEEMPSGLTAYMKVIVEAPGRKYTLTTTSLSVVDLLLPFEVRFTSDGWPETVAKEAKVKFVLYYAGYELPAVEEYKAEKLAELEVVKIKFPLTYMFLKVTTKDGKKLPGLLVEVRSTVTGDVMWRAVTNKSGVVYLGMLPEGKTVEIVIRTLNKKDAEWFVENEGVAKALHDHECNYSDYAKWLTNKTDVTVYTLGTRGPYDENVTVYVGRLKVEAKAVKTVKVREIRPLKIYVVYNDSGKLVVLSSMPVYPCALPAYCPAVYYNVSLLLADFEVHRNASKLVADKKMNYTTVFVALATTWMKPVYERLAEKYEELAEKAAKEADKHIGELTEWKKWMSYYAANETLARTYKFMAEHATETPYAIFTLPVYTVDDEYGIARLFLPTQRLPVKVFYMGYMVFNNYIEVPPAERIYVIDSLGRIVKNVTSLTVVLPNGTTVTVDKGSVVIVADVKPVTIEVYTRDMSRKYNMAVVGLLFTDALINVTAAIGKKENLAVEVLPVMKPFNTTKPVLVVKWAGIAKLNVTTMLYVNETKVGRVAEQVDLAEKVPSLVVYTLPLLAAAYADKESLEELTMKTLPVTSVRAGSVVYNETLLLLPTMNFTEIDPSTGKTYVFVVKPVRPNLTVPVVLTKLAYEYKTAARDETDEENATLKFEAAMTKYNLSKIVLGFDLTEVKKVDRVLAWLQYYNETEDEWYNVTTPIDLTEVVTRYIGRVVNVTLPVDREVLLEKLPAEKVKVRVEVRVEGLEVEENGKLRVTAVFSTGAGYVIRRYNVTVYKNAEGEENTTIVTVPEPVSEWRGYMGSPMLVLAPAIDGVVKLPLPMWSRTTAGYGARIARIYVIAAAEGNIAAAGLAEIDDISRIDIVRVTPELPVPVTLAVYGYVMLNYVELPEKAKMINMTLVGKIELPTEEIKRLGPMLGATSTLVMTAAGMNVVNVTDMPDVIKLRTIVMTKLNITNKADFDIVVTEIKVNETELPVKAVAINADSYKIVDIGYLVPTTVLVNISGYKDGKVYHVLDVVYNRTFENGTRNVNATFRLYKPNVTLTVKYLPKAYEFMTPDGRKVKVPVTTIVKYEKKLTGKTVEKLVRNVTASVDLSEYVPTVDDKVMVPSEKSYGGVEFSYDALPLKRVVSWSGVEPVIATVVVYNKTTDDLCEPIGVSFTDETGKLVQPLPKGERVVVFWYNSFIRFLEEVCGKKSGSLLLAGPVVPTVPAKYYIIYDSANERDVYELGNATRDSTIKTWTYTLKFGVKDAKGRPVPGMVIIVKDKATGGALFYASATTGSDGMAVLRDVRTGVAVVPPGEYAVEIYKPVKVGTEMALVPVAETETGIERGATRPEITREYTLGVYRADLPVRVVLNVPGVGVQKLPGTAELEVTIKVPAFKYEVAPTGAIIVKPEIVYVTEKKVISAPGGEATVPGVIAPVVGVTTMTVKVVKMGAVELGYEETFVLTQANVTGAVLELQIPAVKVELTAVSANEQPLENYATMTYRCTYDGVEIKSGQTGARAEIVLPVPKAVLEGKKALTCEVKVTTVGGVEKSEKITLTAADVERGIVAKKIVVPVTGWLVPGIGFIPWQQLVLIIVAIFIAIIVIVIGLIEYQNWRRKRLAAILGAPAR